MSAPAVTTPGANVHEFTTELIVRHRSTPAEGVVVLDLAHPENEDLPRWEPGAHIDLILDDGLTRQYSLCGDPRDSGVWRVGVLLDPNSRGGSRYVHENLNEGATVRVRGPRNHFPLVDAPHYRFIAGGIGITPIFAMLEAVQRAGGDWTLLYGGRTRASMAFAEDLAAALSRAGHRVAAGRTRSSRPGIASQGARGQHAWCTAVGPRHCCQRSSSTAPTGRQGYFISNGSPPRHLPQRRPLKRSISLRWCASVPESHLR